MYCFFITIFRLATPRGYRARPDLFPVVTCLFLQSNCGRKIWRAKRRLIVWELGRLVPRVFLFSNMGTSLGELLFPLMNRVLAKSFPLITPRIQKSDWVRVLGTGDNVMNILTAAQSFIAPAMVTRLRIYHNGQGNEMKDVSLYTLSNWFLKVSVKFSLKKWAHNDRFDHKKPLFSGIICGSLKKECPAARERKNVYHAWIQRLKEVDCPQQTGAPNVNFWKISVRKTIWDLEFSEHFW